MRDQPEWDAYHRAKAASSQKEVEQYWRVFVDSTSSGMRRFAASCLRTSGSQRQRGDVIEADDVLFEAYRRLLVAKQPAQDPKAWLCSVIRRVVSEWIRSEPRKRVNVEDLENPEHRASPEDLARITVSSVREQATGPHPLRRRLWRAVRALPGCQRRVILGLFFFGIPRDELARRMGIKENTVSQHRSRAIKLLGELLG
jgi:RNA polymerase sigma factor (sigma-70 family)